jgi:hypothetical protein
VSEDVNMPTPFSRRRRRKLCVDVSWPLCAMASGPCSVSITKGCAGPHDAMWMSGE